MSEMNTARHNSWLDLFRGLAALVVCVAHIRNAFWVDYGEIQAKAWWHMTAYLVTGLGHQAVIIFFVLSGFLVGGGVMASGKIFAWLDYFPARLTRLWLVLIPALLFTAACDHLTLLLHPQAFDGRLSSLWNSGPSSLEGFGWNVFVANGLFLQTITVPVFGSNGPLWSLANEFWYYMLFPLMIVSLRFIGTAGFLKRTLMLLLAMSIALWLPREIVIYFSIWLMGVCCFLVIKRYPLKANKLLTFLAAVLFLCALAATKLLTKDGHLLIWSDIALGLVFSLLLACVYGHKVPWRTHGFVGSMIKWLSDFSYSLYLFHFPLVILLAVAMVGTAQLQPNLYSVAVLLGATGLCLSVAWLSWFLFERHNNYVRSEVRRLLSLRTSVRGHWSGN